MMDWLVGRAMAYTIGVPIESKIVDGKSVPVTEYASFAEYFLALIKLANNIAIGLAVMMIVWGAFKYTTSGGDDTRAKDGKDIIVGALVGLALLFLIKVIVPIIQPLPTP